MKVLLVLVSVALTAAAFADDDFQAFPRAYAGLASAGIAGGYHGWTMTRQGASNGWWDVNGSVIEGSYFLTPRFGLGLKVFDGALCPVDSSYPAVMAADLIPTITLVTNTSSRGFGFLSLEVMPYMPDLSGYSNIVSSAIALDYGLVPFAPWPIEGRIRVAGMLFNWESGEVAYYAAAGIHVGLGYWFMRKPSRVRM